MAGIAAALFYYQQGLTLSHYDAKAHLVVARRVLDSLTPEYSQIGAVWLPLPHLLNLLPVQIDAFYRTGASGVAISVLSFALACYAIARLVLRVTGSRVAAALSVAMFAHDPDVLYLQSTPMTEPLLFGLMLLAVSLVYDWVEVEAEPAGMPAVAPDEAERARAKRAGARPACLTRYEAWFVTAALLSLAAIACGDAGDRIGSPEIDRSSSRSTLSLAIVAFFFHSWFTTGAWFVTGGFFVPDNIAHGARTAPSWRCVYGMRMLVGRPLVLDRARRCDLRVLWRGLREARSCRVARRACAGCVHGAAGICVLQGPSVPHALHGRAGGRRDGVRRHRDRPAARAGGAARGRGRDRAVARVRPPGRSMRRRRWCRRRNGTAVQPRTPERHGVPHARVSTASGSSPAWARSRTTCRSCRTKGSASANFVHEGNLPYWQEAIEAPKGRSDGFSSRSAPKAATCSPPARANHLRSSPASRACAPMAGWRSIQGRLAELSRLIRS